MTELTVIDGGKSGTLKARIRATVAQVYDDLAGTYPDPGTRQHYAEQIALIQHGAELDKQHG